MKIIKNLCNKYYDTNNVKYIVLHYTASPNGTAINVSNYFKNSKIQSSAHYVVDEENIVQCVPLNKGAYHAGKKQMNLESIGIEICCYKKNKKSLLANDKDWYFSNKTLDNVVYLILDLLKKYPNAKIIRHYDVTKKICPAPFVHSSEEYNTFLEHVKNKTYYNSNNINIVNITTKTEFKVRINTNALNIRQYPLSSSLITGCIKDRGVYTIVEQKGNWGKLKSGKGWIYLTYTKKI